MKLNLTNIVPETYDPSALRQFSKLIEQSLDRIAIDSINATLALVAADRIQRAAAGGTVNAITATYSPALTLTDQVIAVVISAGENTSTTPTFAPDGLTAHTITARGGVALVAGDIGPAGFAAILEYNLANTRWELLNPAQGRFLQSGAGAVARTDQAKDRDLVSVTDFGAVGDGVTDDTTAITAAITAAVAAGSKVIFDAKTYLVSQLNLTANNSILEGQLASNLGSSGTVIKGSSATLDVLLINAITGYSVSNIVFDRSVTATAGAGIRVLDNATGTIRDCLSQNQFFGFRLGGTNQSTIRDCQAKSNYSDGFRFINGGSPYYPLQWYVDTCTSQLNEAWGFFTYANAGDGSSNITVQHMNLCGTYANNSGGFFWGGGAFHHNNLTCVNCYGSSDGNHEWEFDNPGTSIELVGCFAELAGTAATGRALATAASHVGAGLTVTSSGVSTGFMSLNGFISRQNSYQGVVVVSSAVLAAMNLTDVQCYDNGQYANTVGIHLLNTTCIYTIASSKAKNLLGSTQTYGLLAAVGKNVFASACDFTGNATRGATANDGGNLNAYACNDYYEAGQYPSNIPIGDVAYASLGTDLVHVAGTIYVSEFILRTPRLVTGVAILNGSTVGTDNLIVGIYRDIGGAVAANSNLAGVLSAGANVFQSIPLTATIILQAGRYWVAVQCNGTTCKTRRIAASTYLNLTKSFTGSFGTLASLTIPTTLVADVGPIAYLY